MIETKGRIFIRAPRTGMCVRDPDGAVHKVELVAFELGVCACGAEFTSQTFEVPIANYFYASDVTPAQAVTCFLCLLKEAE